jgi:hypothetical protein
MIEIVKTGDSLETPRRERRSMDNAAQGTA